MAMSVATMCRAILKMTKNEAEEFRNKQSERLLRGDTTLMEELTMSEIVSLMNYANDKHNAEQRTIKTIKTVGNAFLEMPGVPRKFFW